MSLDPFLGKVLKDRYLLSKPVGEGASGHVYRADSLVLPRRFAVKIVSIPGEPDSDEAQAARKRIERETRATTSLRNPHVIQVYDMFDVDDAHVALVMEFIQGRTLQAVVEQDGPLDVWRAIRLARQIANGLYEAHAHNLIHRDVKPENIMIEELPAGDEFVHVLDFGIVWARGEARLSEGFVGTPLYASPDQVLDMELDARSDIYSLGATLFFMLAGRPPFVGGSHIKILNDHVKIPPPRLTEIREDVEGLACVDALVQRLMAKDREARPASLRAVIEELDALERDLPRPHELEPVTIIEPHSVGCSDCSFLRLPPRETGRPGSDVVCMANFGFQVGRDMRTTVASVAQSRVGMVDEHHRITWGSLLVPDNLMTSEPLPSRITRLALANQGTWAGLEDGRVLRITEPESAGMIAYRVDRPIRDLAVDPREHVVAFVTDESRVFVRRGYLGEDFEVLGDFPGATSITVSPTGKHIAIGHESGEIVVVYTATLQPALSEPVVADAPVARLAFSHDDYLLAALTEDGRVVLEVPQVGTQVLELAGFAEDVRDLTFSSRDTLMAICADDRRIFLVDLQCRYAPQCTPSQTFCHLMR